jgi:hypothetical protein
VRNHRQRAVIVAVIAVRMMETTVHEIVDMIAMRHGFVPTIRPMPMRRLVATGVMLRIAAIRIAVAHGDHMLLGAAALGMFQVTVIEIIDVAFVSHGEMTAGRAVNVGRSLARCHGGVLSLPTLNHWHGLCRTSPPRKRGHLDAFNSPRSALPMPQINCRDAFVPPIIPPSEVPS